MDRLRQYLVPDDYYRLEFELKGYQVNWDKVVEFVESRNLSNINKPSAYIRSMITKEIKENGRFIRSVEMEATPNLQPLFNDLRSKGVVVDENDTIYIDLLITALIDCGVDNKKITDLLIRTTEKMNKGDKLAKFIALLRIEKVVLHSGIDFEALKERYQETVLNWNKLEESLKEIPNNEI